MKIATIRQIDDRATLPQVQKLADATSRREFGVMSVEGRFYLIETKDGGLPGRMDDESKTARMGDEVYIPTPRGPIQGKLILIDQPNQEAFSTRRNATLGSALVGALVGAGLGHLLTKGSKYGWAGVAAGAVGAAGVMAAGAALAHTDEKQPLFKAAKLAKQQIEKLTVAIVE